MPIEVLRRDLWSGGSRDLGDLFRLAKGGRDPRCQILTYPLSWELKLLAGDELLQSQVCRSWDDVLSTGEEWKVAIREKGWGK